MNRSEPPLAKPVLLLSSVQSDWEPRTSLLIGRTILVTGAGDGIGRAAARSFAEHGAVVVLLDKSITDLELVYDLIEQAGGPTPAIYPLNLETATVSDYQELASTIKRELGGIHGILHNAAVCGPLAPIEHYNVELWFKTLQINLNAPFLLTQALLPLLRKADDASLVFTSDEAGRRGKAYWGAYGAAKFGLEGLSEMLAEEYRDNTKIRSNSIDPGPTRTKMRAAAYPADNPANWPEPETLMKTYLYLMSPDSIGVTGERFSAQKLTSEHKKS